MSLEWVESSLCRKYDPEWWFRAEHSGEHALLRKVRGICNACPVLPACREYGIDTANEVPFGVWGGMTGSERRKALRIAETIRLHDRLRGTA